MDLSNDWLDSPSAVREGEFLDPGKLGDYLSENIPELEHNISISQFPNGFSNLTYLVRSGRSEFVLRRPPFGANIKGGHDMHREFRILTKLFPVFPKVPNPIHYCDDPEIIGAPFYIMERLSGIILRPRMPPEMVPDSKKMNEIAISVIDNLVEIHRLDYRSAGLAEFGRPEAYIERQIAGWGNRYHNAETNNISDMEVTAQWLGENIPADSNASLIHNDYKYDNLVLDSADWSNIIGVLDWEMATIGNPLMDLGTTLAYWVQANDPEEMQALKFSPTTLPGNPTREDIVERYVLKSGRQINNLTFYYVYGLFKLAVIVQQIFYRYKKGLTQDSRFANLLPAVKACAGMAVSALKQPR